MKEDPIENTKLIELGFIDSNRIKVFEKECPSLNHIMVYDIRTAGIEENEDYIYASSPDLQYNLRKGHTIVEVYDENDFSINKYSVVARKGPRKYYSLREKDLERDEEYFKKLNSIFPSFSKYDTSSAKNEKDFNEMIRSQIFRNYSLSPVYQSFWEGNTVEVYRSTFTIGEHAQISYLATEKVWVIASKHASIFLRNAKDLEAYKLAPRALFNAPRKIGEYWLKFFEHNIKDKNGFLRAVDRKTLCATFVDNQLFDCLVEYERPILLFHAIVENDVNNSTCLPPDQSYAFFFKKWGMDSSPLTSVGEFESYEELRKTLVTLQK